MDQASRHDRPTAEPLVQGVERQFGVQMILRLNASRTTARQAKPPARRKGKLDHPLGFQSPERMKA
jgi:hypothetical protein